MQTATVLNNPNSKERCGAFGPLKVGKEFIRAVSP